MENNIINQNEEKLIQILKYAPVGLAEIDSSGKVISLNIKGNELLHPIIEQYNLTTENIFPILAYIAPDIVNAIQNFTEEKGVIFQNKTYKFILPGKETNNEIHFLLTTTQLSRECIIISFEDITEKYIKEQEMMQADMEKEIEQGKFEIASGVLHDIGNAVVGFGSYLTRIKRLQEQITLDNLTNLAIFFEKKRNSIARVIGEAKADAVVDMLNGIAEQGKNALDEIKKSIVEQGNIIVHIHEILNIQRQYITGQDSAERKPVNLRSIINDSMSMLFASFDKRGIEVSINISNELPPIKGDRTKLMQVILNILKNSLEAIDINAPDNTISVELYKQEPDSVVLKIKDSGAGFDQSIAGNLFKRGFTTKPTGTGLGLYNCKTIIESHSGTIAVTSDGPGKGALTIITLKI